MAIIPGGLTASPTFISEYHDALPNSIGMTPPGGSIITGENGTQYYVAGGKAGGGGGGQTLEIFNAATGVLAFSKTVTDFRNDASTAGVVPPNPEGTGFVGGSCGIPETPYIVTIGGSASGTDTDKRVLYYKINSSSALELVGGYAGDEGDLDVQNSPPSAQGDAYVAAGHILENGTTGTINDIAYKFPIALAYAGEGRSTVTVIPSINYIITNTPITETVSSDNWLVKELSLANSAYDSNIFFTEGSEQENSRGFFLPIVSGVNTKTLFMQMFYTIDLEEHDGGSPGTTSTYLTTNAPTYPTGLISSVVIELTGDSTKFGFTPSFGTSTVSLNGSFLTESLAAAFPFDDDKKKYDGSASTAVNSYYCNPSVYPTDKADPQADWLIFWPHIFRDSGDRDKIGIRVFAWSPVQQKATYLDYAQAQVFTIGSDVDSNTELSSASVTWDRVTGDLTLLMRSEATGEDALIVSEFGTFEIQETVDDTTITSEELKVRAWTFPLDGHTFYVLRLGQQGTYVYDILTEQWSEWKTTGYNVWNADHGLPEWNGYAIAGDTSMPLVYNIDPDLVLDEGTIPVTRTVTCIIPNRERDPIRVGEMRVTASVGDPYQDDTTISTRWSDDQGQSYTTPISIPLDEDDFSQVLRYRSLGRVLSPGRIIEITDVGGAVRINGADVDLVTR